MDASVVIRFKGPKRNDVEVSVLDHGKPASEEEAKWIAYLALPHLERLVFSSEKRRQRYHLEIARPLIGERLA